MRILINALFICLLVWPVQVTAQEKEDKSFLENKLQDLLSGAGREVSITGFEGALSSNARLAEMTISDAEGVWLTMRDAQLVWTRSALLRGRLDIDQLSAREIELTRLPVSESSLEISDSEVEPFALPELPVSVDIEALTIEQIVLKENLLGEEALLSASGRLFLSDGNGDAALEILRTDRNDQLRLNGAFSNQTRVLALDVDFTEDKAGLVSRMIGIPEEPALGLQIKGEAPLSDYNAKLILSSDNEPRFSGEVNIRQQDGEDAAYAVQANLSGDVRPLFTPDLHPFFGDLSSLRADALFHPGGKTDLKRFELSSGALKLAGSLSLAADGWPERFDLSGEISSDETVRLPVSGPATTIENAIIAARFNAATGDSWFANVTVVGLDQEQLQIGKADLLGEGVIRRSPESSLSGSLSFRIKELETSNPAMNEALGNTLLGSTLFDWNPDTPLSLTSLTLQSDGLNVRADAELDQLADGFPLSGRATIETTNISRFSGVLERDLTGSVEATVSGSAILLSGAFDVILEAETLDLQIDEPRLDPVLGAKTNLRISASRNAAGTDLRFLNLNNKDAVIVATGQLSANQGTLAAEASLSNIGLIEPRLAGVAEGELDVAWSKDEPIRLETLRARIGETTVFASGELQPYDQRLPASGTLSLKADDLSRFADILGFPLEGKLDADLKGAAELRGDLYNLEFDISGANVRSGLTQLDNLIAGDVSAIGSIATTDAALDLQYLKMTSANLMANATGSGPGEPIAISTRLSDLALITDSISGPFAARGTLVVEDRLAKRILVNVDASGAGGITAKVLGSIQDYGQILRVTATGRAPMQLANRFITPRSVQGDLQFDLAVNGPPQLASLAGGVTFSDARVALPRLGYGLRDLAGSITLSQGSANLEVSGSTGTTGRFEVNGPIVLSPPFSANLIVQLISLGLSDFVLYSTKVSGSVNIDGPLLGGAFLSGALALNETELRVPSGSGVTIGTLPELTHIAEPKSVSLTRKRAGLIEKEGGATADFPIDVSISSPNQIFVRGRGLDAELGGQIRLTGSTTNVIPSGTFELLRGRLDLLGKRLDLVEGLIDMRGALDPYLRFVAETEADDVLIRVIVDGLASAPTVTFTSEPDFPQEEVVARLLFGRGLDNISPFQAAQLVAAVATLTGRYDGGVVGSLRKSLGLSDLDISTTQDGTTEVRAGAYLSENIYTEVVADSEGKEEINLNLDISRNVTIRGSANDEGNTGLGVFFERDY